MWKTCKKKKKKNCRTVIFAVLADHKIKVKERKGIEGQVTGPYWGIEKLWNMKLTTIPIVIGALGTVTKGLILGLEDLEIRGRI